MMNRIAQAVKQHGDNWAQYGLDVRDWIGHTRAMHADDLMMHNLEIRRQWGDSMLAQAHLWEMYEAP